MLATQKDRCCLIQPTSILSRDPSSNNCLTSVSTNSDSPIVDCRPLDNSNQRCNKRLSELNSLVEQGKNGYWADRIERLAHRCHGSIPDPINQQVPTAVNHCQVHLINTIVFGCYRGLKKFAAVPKTNAQKFVQMPQAATSSTFTPEPGNRGPRTTPLRIKFFGLLCPRIYLEASPFLSGGGVSKHQ
ncbi:hypothetical protein [Microcoleus sp. BROC3]|uniref:hypothetical protein n=1 Tax=Microcoleus sp. BROC3 TaxID=3055323 RepID=UPI002FD5F6F4